MTCDAVRKLIPLYFYGELPAGEEDRVEAHLQECAACAGEMDRMASLAVRWAGARRKCRRSCWTVAGRI